MVLGDATMQETLYARGGEYIDAEFPRMDRIAWVEVAAAAAPLPGALSGAGARAGMLGEGAGAVWWLLMVLTAAVGLAMWVRRCVVSAKVRSRVLEALASGGGILSSSRCTPLFSEQDEGTATGTSGGGVAASSLASQAAPVPRDEEEEEEEEEEEDAAEEVGVGGGGREDAERVGAAESAAAVG
jgi:hypothetical protein